MHCTQLPLFSTYNIAIGRPPSTQTEYASEDERSLLQKRRAGADEVGGTVLANSHGFALNLN